MDLILKGIEQHRFRNIICAPSVNKAFNLKENIGI
jgi:hypothetical protein